MQRVLDLLKDDFHSPVLDSKEPVWILGHKYSTESGVWTDEILQHVNQLIWLMYRTQFATPIPRHPDGPSPLLQNFNAFFRSGPYAVQASSLVDSFTSDVGWGCMIRTGQSLLANALSKLHREHRALSGSGTTGATGKEAAAEIELLRKFTDDPTAPYSIHRFVDFGSTKCGKLPGQWFGPSAVAACISEFAEPPLSVYISCGADVYEQDLLALEFPVLVLCGLRLGIQEVNPIYYEGLRSLLMAKQSVGIAGGRTSASHYFYGFHGTRLLYHDPHEPKPSLRQDSPDSEYLTTMHSQRLRALEFEDMDPSMLAGFLLTSKEDFDDWKQFFSQLPLNKSVLNITSLKPQGDFLDDLSGEEEETSDAEDGKENVTVGDDESQGPTGGKTEEALASERAKNVEAEQRRSVELVDHPGRSFQNLSKVSRQTSISDLNIGSSSRKNSTYEPIAQEAIVTVDINEPGDESSVEVTNPGGQTT